MKYRQFGQTGWQVSEMGYGMWGMAEWSGSDDEESLLSLGSSTNRLVGLRAKATFRNLSIILAKPHRFRRVCIWAEYSAKKSRMPAEM